MKSLSPPLVLLLLAVLGAPLLLAACSAPVETDSLETEPPETGDAPAIDRAEVAAAITGAMDRDADPCQDFYRYACGAWSDSTELPADQGRWTRTGSVLAERNRELLREILEQPGEGEGAKPRTFYAACMDEAAVEAAGLDPLAPWLEKIEALGDRQGVMRLAGELHRHGVPAFFETYVFPDFDDPTVYTNLYSQGGLGLPERDFYLRDDDPSRQLLAAYEAHVARMLDLLAGREAAEEPSAEARRQAQEIVELETRLARASRRAAEMRDMTRLNNPMSRDELRAATPALAWDAYWQATGFEPTAEVTVATPEFFEALGEVVADTELETLRRYLRWQLVHATAPLLSSAVAAENFAFFGRTLSGQKEQQARWKRCITATDEALGESLGKLWVERHFPGDSKQIALDMIEGIEKAFEKSLPELDWMDETTRSRAREKAQAIRNKIGYPDVWRDYSALEVEQGGYFANALAARAFEYARNQRRAGGPVDRDEWLMSPPTVNAYYNPTLNEIVFPAGILQPTVFHRDYPMSVNFGGIGAVMGHELTHGFDDSGRKFDAEGRLREWWEPEVSERFDERAACVEKQYGAYEVEPGLNLDGKLTLGENIADLGGVKEAHRAYRAWIAEHGEPQPPVVEGLTDEQLFFVSYAQVWCAVASPEYLRLQARTDSHSTPRYRVIGPLSNLPAFGEAFSCPVGSPMRPEKVCEVW